MEVRPTGLLCASTHLSSEQDEKSVIKLTYIWQFVPPYNDGQVHV